MEMLSDDVNNKLALTCIILFGLYGLYLLIAIVISYATSNWWPSIDLRGKRVFITGGSAGIGLEMAKSFAARGASVIISARRDDVLRSAVAEINIHAATNAKKGITVLPATYVSMDVSDESAVTAGVDAAMKIYNGVHTPADSAASGDSGSPLLKKRRNSTARTPRGSVAQALATPTVYEQPIDILVCNAGYSYPSRFLDAPVSEAKRQMDINFFGCVNVIRAVLPSMFAFHEKHPRAPPSRIVCISSLAAVVPAAGFTIYAPTKAAIVAFCHSLDMESASKGVRAQVVYPPDVATPGFDKENLVKSEECKKICEFGGNAPFTAAQMGSSVVDSIASGGGFAITLGLDGWLLSHLGSMMQPGTFGSNLCDMLGVSTVGRIVGCIFSKIHYSIVAGVTANDRRRKD